MNTYIPMHTKNEILPLATTWMDPKGIILNENKSDRKIQILYALIYMQNL